MRDVVDCPMTGRQVVSYLDSDYKGFCRLRYAGDTGIIETVVFSTVEQAEIAACWAILHDKGGYNEVTLHATNTEPEYHTAECWFFS